MMLSFFTLAKKKQLSFLILLILILLNQCAHQPYQTFEFNNNPTFYKQQTPPPSIKASSALLIHYPSMSIVYEKDAYVERPIASLQKLLTALLVKRPDYLQEKIILKKADFKDYDPQSIKLRPNEAYTREQIIKMLLVSSNNIAANTLARTHSGNTTKFVKEMNQLALQLGMTQSHFNNAHGLTQGNQYSTAADATKLAIYAYQSPFIASLCSQSKIPLYDSKEQILNNTNALLKQAVITRDYRCVGLKTGYTQASGYCLSLVITNDKQTFFLTLLNSSRAEIYRDALKLFKHTIQSSYFHDRSTSSSFN